MVIAALIVVATGAAAGKPDHPIEVTSRKPEDSIAVSATNGTTVVSVISQSGIGGATLRRGGPRWSAPILIRLKLNNLESFDMSNGTIRFNTFARSARVVPYWRIRSDAPRPRAPDGKIDVPIRRTDDGFEIEVPAVMLKGDPKVLEIRWVNEFRG